MLDIRPHWAVANVTDQRQGPAFTINVVFPRKPCSFEPVGQSREVEARGLLGTIAVRVDYHDGASGGAITSNATACTRHIIDRSSRLSRQCKEVIWETWAMDGSKIMICEDEVSCVLPVVRNLLFVGLRIG